MARTKRTRTAVENEYLKERRRIQRAIRRMERNQYYINSMKPVLPPIPKRITPASVRRLKRITSESLYKRAVYLDVETGEIIPANIRRREVRREAARRAAQTRRTMREIKEELETTTKVTPENRKDAYKPYPSASRIILANFRADVISRFPGSAGPLLSQWLDELLRLYDEDEVAQMLQDAADAGVNIDYKVAYNNELLLGTIARMMAFLEGASLGVREDIIEALEYEENWELPE